MTPQQNQQQRIIPLLDLDLDERRWEVASDEDIIRHCRNAGLLSTETDGGRFFSFSNH
ncbi:MAG: hypothetical protein GX466_08840 [Candidatus Cloacimonetes bacterium]|nr:hypothetical protein [Candidatus Cloacimonadota bacterium]